MDINHRRDGGQDLVGGRAGEEFEGGPWGRVVTREGERTRTSTDITQRRHRRRSNGTYCKSSRCMVMALAAMFIDRSLSTPMRARAHLDVLEGIQSSLSPGQRKAETAGSRDSGSNSTLSGNGGDRLVGGLDFSAAASIASLRSSCFSNGPPRKKEPLGRERTYGYNPVQVECRRGEGES